MTLSRRNFLRTAALATLAFPAIVRARNLNSQVQIAAVGVDVVAVSVITNVANPDAPEATDAEDVCRLAAGAADGLWGVIRALATDVAGGGPEGSTTIVEDR